MRQNDFLLLRIESFLIFLRKLILKENLNVLEIDKKEIPNDIDEDLIQFFTNNTFSEKNQKAIESLDANFIKKIILIFDQHISTLSMNNLQKLDFLISCYKKNTDTLDYSFEAKLTEIKHFIQNNL